MWFVDCSSILHSDLGRHIFINQSLVFNRYVCGPINLARRQVSSLTKRHAKLNIHLEFVMHTGMHTEYVQL